MIFIKLLIFTQLRLFATEAEYIESPRPLPTPEAAKEKNWGINFSAQTLNTSLIIKEGDRQFEVRPEPPTFSGFGFSYMGIGYSFRSADPSSEERSKSNSFKITSPWRRHFIEAYYTSSTGADVSLTGFREDVRAKSFGLHVSRALDPDFKFSSFYGLEDGITSEEKKKTKTSFLAASYQDIQWSGDSTFIAFPTGPTDRMAFDNLKRKIGSLSWGGVYVRYRPYYRFGALGSIGGFYGKRQMKYDTRGDLTESEFGYAVNVALSIASDYGFQDWNKKYSIACGYGFSLIVHNAETFSGLKLSTDQTEGILYIGTLF